MSEELDFKPDVYTLVDEDGKESLFEMLDVMEYESQTYYALVPYYENPEDLLGQEDESLVILKLEVVDGEETLASIDDDDEYMKIGNMFLERLDNCECDDDCDCDCDDENCNCGEDDCHCGEDHDCDCDCDCDDENCNCGEDDCHCGEDHDCGCDCDCDDENCNCGEDDCHCGEDHDCGCGCH